MIESRQINNLRIRHNGLYAKYQVITPDKRVLEEFDRWEDAVKCAESIKDFVVKKED
jgi:hypothetical protein